MKEQLNNPMHGVTLKDILVRLVDHYGWPGLGNRIKVGCFKSNPSLESSLKFLRKTPWARKKVEALYAEMLEKVEGNKKPKERINVWKTSS